MRNKTAHPDRFITPAEIAARYGVSSRTVGMWARKGVIPAQFTPTGRVRLVRADVEAALEKSSAA